MITSSLNPQAGNEYLSNIETYAEKAKESAEESEKNIYDNKENQSLKFNEYNTVHDQIRGKLSEIAADKEGADENKVKRFLNFLLNQEKWIIIDSKISYIISCKKIWCIIVIEVANYSH